MKALSISQPWAWSIFDPIADKGCENRSWPPPPKMIGQTIAVHAAKSWDAERVYMLPKKGHHGLLTPTGYFLALRLDHAPATRDQYVAGAITGVATIERVVCDMDMIEELPWAIRRWYFGPYGWLWPKRQALPTPIPCVGKQGLWTVPKDVEEEIHRQLGTVN